MGGTNEEKRKGRDGIEEKAKKESQRAELIVTMALVVVIAQSSRGLMRNKKLR